MKQKGFCLGAVLMIALLFNSIGDAADWFVDGAAKGKSTGRTWADAWASFGSVKWGPNGVSPGDTLFISGGTSQRVYNEPLVVRTSGAKDKPIYIKVGQQSPHNGRVVIDLRTYKGPNTPGIVVNTPYVEISGRRSGSALQYLKVINSKSDGVYIYRDAHDFKISYIEATLNRGHGLFMNVPQHSSLGEINDCKFYNNGLDEMWLIASDNASVRGNYFGSLKVYNNVIYNWHLDAVKIRTDGVDFFGNTIRDRGAYKGDHPDGIQAWSSYLRIFENQMSNFIRSGSDVNVNSYIRYNPDRQVEHVYIYNNSFTERRPPQPKLLLRGIELSLGFAAVKSVKDVYVVDNSFVGTPFFGLYLGFGQLSSNDVSNVVVMNNTFEDVCFKANCSTVFVLDQGNGTIAYGSADSSANVILDHNNIIRRSDDYKDNIKFGPSFTSYNIFRKNTGTQASQQIGGSLPGGMSNLPSSSANIAK